MPGLSGVIQDFLDRFSLFATRSTSSPQLFTNAYFLTRNINSLKTYIGSLSQSDKDDAERAIKKAKRAINLSERRQRGISTRKIHEDMDDSYKALRDLGIKYNIRMDWSSYSEFLQISQPVAASSTVTSRSLPVHQPAQGSAHQHTTQLIRVRVCIWNRFNVGPEVISHLDQPDHPEWTKSYTGTTQLNRVLSELVHQNLISLEGRIRCYTHRDNEHLYTTPGLRWSSQDENRPLASLPPSGHLTVSIHIVQDSNPFLIFVLFVQPSERAHGIVVSLPKPEQADVVDGYITQGLALNARSFHYQHLEGGTRLRLEGFTPGLRPYSCDWCILGGHPTDAT